MANTQRNYYSNPAFCQQSEFYNSQLKIKSSSPKKNPTPRQSPIGANTYHQQYCEKPKRDYEEQEFYEEVLVDNNGQVKRKNLVVVTSPNNEQKYYATNRNTHRYEEIPDRYEEGLEEDRNEVYVDDYPLPAKRLAPGGGKGRYEYIPLATQEEVAAKQVIDTGAIREGYALVRKNDRYELLPLEKVSDTYRYNQTPTKNRYEYIQQTTNQSSRYEIVKTLSPQPQRRPVNPAATQKLHELLSTPKKTLRSPPNTPRTPSSPSPRDPFVTPPKKQTPRAQQKLNYALSTRQMAQMTQDKRSTAIISPVCSSPVQSVYSETTMSNRTESWMNLSISKAPVQATLAVAAVMMILCGGVTCGLCFYMISIMGRLYYLDFGVLSGFTCLLLGLLGFRSRNCYWLPNRNFISGYIILSVFSLLTCAGLLVLLFTQPKPGSPLADMTSGAVCGISVLSLVLASGGVLASYCCKYPPPDNRVQHCARGFTV